MSAAVPRNDDRFAELVARLSPQFELPVYGSAQILFGVGGLVIAGVVFFWGLVEESNAAIAGAMVLFAGAALFLSHRLPTLGQPRLVVTTAGFRLPHTPLISWPLVEGIWLEKIRHQRHPLTIRHQVIAHVLIFHIPSLPDRIGDFPWFTKLLYPLRTRTGKKRLRVVLVGSSEDPEVVYRLARHLWKQSTGRDYPWFPDMTEEAAAAYRKDGEAFARMREYLQRGPAADPREFKRLMAGLEENMAAMRQDSQRRQDRFWWIAVAALIGLVVLILFSLREALT